MPDLHWEHVFGLPSWLWIAILTPAIVACMARLGQKPPVTRDGWQEVKPGLMLMAMMPLAFLLALLFFIAAVAALVDLATGIAPAPFDWILVVLGPPLTGMMTYTFFYLCFVRLRFNPSGIEQRIFRKIFFLTWPEIAIIDRHWFFGPRIRANSGKTIIVWEYLRGFGKLLEFAEQNRIPVKL